MDLGSPPPLDCLQPRTTLASERIPDYLRSVNGESGSFGMAPSTGRLVAPSKLWVTMVFIIIVIFQVVSTTGIFVYFNMSIAQAKSQGVTEELRCLGLLNALEKDQEIPDGLVQLFGEPCIKLAEGIRSYISKVTENIISKHTFQERRAAPPRKKLPSAGNSRPSAHLTLRDNGLQGPTSLTPQPDLHQSCRHVVRSWANQSFGTHLQNMTVSDGRLRVPRSGRYYLYAQVYFRYIALTAGAQPHPSTASHQVVQCVYKKTAYARPILLLKGVGTKCWAPNSENALHSVYQGGLFELQAGDQIFVSVSAPTAVHAEDSSSYFGAFRYDL